MKRQCIILFKKDPTLVTFSALTASILHARCISQMVIDKGIRNVIGGLHATALSELESNYFSSVVIWFSSENGARYNDKPKTNYGLLY